MKFLLIICSFFIAMPLRAQKNLPLGEGVIKLDIGQKPVLEFFNDTADLKPAETIRIVMAVSGDFEISKAEANKWFEPEQLFLNYDILVLRVDKSSGNWKKIIVNSNTGRTMWLRNAADRPLITWKDFLQKEVFSVQKREGFDLSIRKAPDRPQHC